MFNFVRKTRRLALLASWAAFVVALGALLQRAPETTNQRKADHKLALIPAKSGVTEAQQIGRQEYVVLVPPPVIAMEALPWRRPMLLDKSEDTGEIDPGAEA